MLVSRALLSVDQVRRGQRRLGVVDLLRWYRLPHGFSFNARLTTAALNEAVVVTDAAAAAAVDVADASPHVLCSKGKQSLFLFLRLSFPLSLSETGNVASLFVRCDQISTRKPPGGQATSHWARLNGASFERQCAVGTKNLSRTQDSPRAFGAGRDRVVVSPLCAGDPEEYG